MLQHLTPQTIKAIFDELTQKWTSLGEAWKNDPTEETFREWQQVGEYRRGVVKQYKDLTGIDLRD